MADDSPILSDMSESGGDPRDLTDQQLAQLRTYFNGSLFAFAWTFFNFKDLQGSGYRPVHREVCQILGMWGQDPTEPWHPGRRLMIQIPRGAYKTSLCTLSNALWQICRNPAETVLICNEVLDNSRKWLRAIRETVMGNRLFQAVYKDLLPPGVHWTDKDRGINLPQRWKWTDQELLFARPNFATPEASLTAAAVGSATTGGHWTRIIKDDLVSEDAKNSPALMQKARDWFDSSLPLEQPPYQGIDLIVCTPWTYNDVYRHALEKYDYKLYRRSVIEEHPKTGKEYSLLPGKWTVEMLHKERERDPFYFSAQMMCMPRAGKEQAFAPEWLRSFEISDDREPIIRIQSQHYSEEVTQLTDERGNFVRAPQEFPLFWCSRVMLVDPASADENVKTRSSYARTGIVIVACDPWGRRFVLDCWAGKANPDDVIQQIWRLASKWKVTRVGIEEVTFSIVYQYWLQREAQRRGEYLSIQPLKPKGRHKEDRITQLIPGFQRGFYYLNAKERDVGLLKREYLDYPYAQTRDLMDALAYNEEVLKAPETPSVLTGRDREDDEYRLNRKHLDVTGYGEPYF